MDKVIQSSEVNFLALRVTLCFVSVDRNSSLYYMILEGSHLHTTLYDLQRKKSPEGQIDKD